MIKKIEREIMNIGSMFNKDKLTIEEKLLSTLKMFKEGAADKIFYRGFKLTTNRI